MSKVIASQTRQQLPAPARAAAAGLLQRTCACGSHASGGECEDCKKNRQARVGQPLQRSPARRCDDLAGHPAPPIVHEVLREPGTPLDVRTRADLEPHFGQDFSQVRVHSGERAERSAEEVGALAYTVGQQIVFGANQFSPGTGAGRQLLAHELVHTVQQSRISPGLNQPVVIQPGTGAWEAEAASISRKVNTTERGAVDATSAAPLTLQRLCSPAGVCALPIAGSAEEFNVREERAERGPRERRRRMSPARQRSTGHVGHARQLENFLNSQSPGLLSNVHGIFIDMDMSRGTAAMISSCSSMVPPITGAVKPCMFIQPHLNQQALAFNTTSDARIGGRSREDWRVSTLQLLTHEIQHVFFDPTAIAVPAGIVSPTCTRANLESELTEINAQMMEFVIAFRAIPPGAGAAHPARRRLSNWFNTAITNPDESFSGAITAMGCNCECAEVNAFIVETFNFVSSTWTAAEKDAFNAEMRRPVWGLNWPL